MKPCLCVLAATLLSALAIGQQVATPFTADSLLPSGGAAYLDLTVGAAGGITVTGVQVGIASARGTTGTIEVWKCPTTRVGNEQNGAVWTLVASGAVEACCPDEGTSVDLAPFTLPAGSYGIALHAVGVELALFSSGALATAVGGLSTPGDLVLSAGEAATAVFSSPPIPARTVNCKFQFGLGMSLITPANTEVYGCGCGQCPASFHETFPQGLPVDLVSWTMIPSASGWVVIPNVATWVAPSGAATTLPLGDDDETVVTLSAPFPHHCPNAAFTQLTVCSNGFVSLTNGNGTDWDPSATKLLNAPATAWWAWHDFDQTIPGSGHVQFEEIANVAYVTWDGVWDFGGTSGANASWVQFQFDMASGIVHVVFAGTSTFGNRFVTGYSPGGPSIDLGPTDISAGTTTICCVEQSSMHLDTLYRPVLGQPIQFLTTHMPPAPFLIIGYSVTKWYPGVPIMGAGCALYHDWSGPIDAYFATPPTQATVSAFPPLATIALPIGLTFYAQAVAITASGPWIWSNGVELTVGSY